MWYPSPAQNALTERVGLDVSPLRSDAADSVNLIEAYI
jgi:hypothetical protein